MIQLSMSEAAVKRVAGAAPRFKAVAFDYFVLFDPDSVVLRAEELFPGKGLCGDESGDRVRGICRLDAAGAKSFGYPTFG